MRLVAIYGVRVLGLRVQDLGLCLLRVQGLGTVAGMRHTLNP